MGKSIDTNFSFIIFFQLALVIGGLVWLFFNDVESATKMLILFLTAVAGLVLVMFFVRESDSQSIFNLLKVPFATNDVTAAFMLLLGWVIIAPTWFLFQSAQGLLVPLAATETTQQVLSLQALQALVNPFLNLFHVVFVASNIEEFVFGFVLMLIGALIVVGIVSALKIKMSLSAKKNVAIVGGLIVSVSAFAFLHTLNNSYTTTGMFVAAGIFRLLMNLSIYKLGGFLSFTIGIHQANNFGWYLQTFGVEKTLEGIFNPAGLIFFLLYFGLIITIVLLNVKDIPKIISDMFTVRK